MGGRCGSTIFVLAILLCEVPDASRGTGEHHRHAPHARGNRAMVASLGLAKINWVPCPAVGPMGVPIRGVWGVSSIYSYRVPSRSCRNAESYRWRVIQHKQEAQDFGRALFVSLRTVLLFAAMGLPPLPPLKMATDPPRFFADRLFGLPSWHAAVLLSTTHAREPKPQTTPTKP